MNILLKLTGAIALSIGAQIAMVNGVAAGSLPTHSGGLFSQILAADTLPEQVFTSETYQPPDNGGPTSSQGSGTR